MIKLRADVVENAASIEHGFGQVRGRLTSLETRSGKTGARERQEEYMAELRKELQQFTGNNNLTSEV